MNHITEDQIQLNVDVDIKAFASVGIVTDSRLSIRKSSVGGTGVFFESPVDIDDEIILRVSYAATFNLQTLMARLEALKITNDNEAEITRRVLKCCRGSYETEIISDFMFSFMIILTNRSSTENCPVSEIEYYLEILSQTTVDTLDIKERTVMETDIVFEVERNKKQALKDKYDELVLSLKDLGLVIPTFDEYYHINKVIKSRVLEIPHAVEGNLDDFEVNTTLVPVLDFVNHLHQNNAYFDIDRNTSDVILKYLAKAGTHEVFIKYSDIAQVQLFVTTYGFIPEAEVQYLDLVVNKYEINDYINQIQGTESVCYDLIMKWLEILPTIHVLVTHDKIGISYDLNPIPFWVIFTQPFEYIDWHGKESSRIVNDPDLLVQGTSDESIAHLIEFQEERCDVIQGIDKIAVKPDEISDINRKEAIQKFDTFVKLVFSKRHLTRSTDGFTSRYLEYKNQIFERGYIQTDFEVHSEAEAEPWYKPVVIYDFI